MPIRSFTPNHPLVLGLAGEAASGKTITAMSLAPIASMIADSEDGASILWNRLFFAMPLYEIVRTRRDIEGPDARDRMRYEIHSILLEVFGNSPLYGAPPYSQLVEMVEAIVAAPLTGGAKERSFMQTVGTDICRAYDPNCWVNWMRRKVNELYREFSRQLPEDSETLYGIAIDDVRFTNEAQYVANQPNGVLLKLTVDPEVQAQRIYDRDGIVMTPEQLSHPSERAVSEIPNELFSEVIDTSDMTVAEQVDHIRKVVTSITGVVI